MAALWIAQVVIFATGGLGPWRDALARATNGRLPLAARMKRGARRRFLTVAGMTRLCRQGMLRPGM